MTREKHDTFDCEACGERNLYRYTEYVSGGANVTTRHICKGAKMTKLYLSGGIANVPDFEEMFASNAEALEAVGYEVVNPVNITADCTPQHMCADFICSHTPARNKCLTLGEPGTPGDPHSWACYLRYDLIAMLECDAVAIIESTFWNSKGAHLEEYVAMQVLMPRFPVQYWLDDALKSPTTGDIPTF